jgi:hypothetical protein
MGIASYREMKARTMAVARDTRRIAADEPKVWLTSIGWSWTCRLLGPREPDQSRKVG